MIPYDLDPSLHAQAPQPQMLDDGFSPPHHDIDADEAKKPLAHEHADGTANKDFGLGPKSPF